MRRAIKIGIAVVIAVLVGIAIALAPSVVTVVNVWRFNATPKVRQMKAGQDERSFMTALQLFRDDVGRYPNEHEGLEILFDSSEHSHIERYKRGGYISGGDLKDPWDHPYRYCVVSRGELAQAIVCSDGADGERGGIDEAGDDVCAASDAPENSTELYCDGS